LVFAALRAAAKRAAGDLLSATSRAWWASALRETVRCGSSLSASSAARDRFADGRFVDFVAACVVPRRAFSEGSLLPRGELDARPACLRQPNGDRLLRQARAVLSLSDVLDLLANEFARLRRHGLAFALRFPRTRARHLVGYRFTPWLP
jgi:hypothetical protein